MLLPPLPVYSNTRKTKKSFEINKATFHDPTFPLLSKQKKKRKIKSLKKEEIIFCEFIVFVFVNILH